MKALVDTPTNLIRGMFVEPLSFSTSGHYVIDVPSQISIKPVTNVVADLLTLKTAAWKAVAGLANSISDELLAVPDVDVATANITTSRVIVGPYKRTTILPGGVLVTNILATGGGTQLFLHYNGNLLTRQDVDSTNPINPSYPPARVLHDYNPLTAAFSPFTPSTLTVSLVNPNTPFALITTPTPDTKVTVAVPASFRLSFTNTSSLPYHLSDWILLYG